MTSPPAEPAVSWPPATGEPEFAWGAFDSGVPEFVKVASTGPPVVLTNTESV